jgi:Tfp pilus assembly protein PilZ
MPPAKPSRRLGRRFQVRFRPLDGGDAHVGYTTNISQTGMFVATIRPLKPGTEIDIEVSDKQSSLRLDAVVVHARKVPASWQRIRPSGMGVRFLDMQAHAEGLRQLVGPSASLW